MKAPRRVLVIGCAMSSVIVGLCVIFSQRLGCTPHAHYAGAYLAALTREFLAWKVSGGGEADRVYLPTPDRFSTSTEYFRYVVTNDWLKAADFGAFALKGVPPARTEDPYQFSAANNAWCVIATSSSVHQADVPLLITRNVSCLMPETRDITTPFGTNIFLVITWQGKLKMVTGGEGALDSLNLPKDRSRILFP